MKLKPNEVRIGTKLGGRNKAPQMYDIDDGKFTSHKRINEKLEVKPKKTSHGSKIAGNINLYENGGKKANASIEMDLQKMQVKGKAEVSNQWRMPFIEERKQMPVGNVEFVADAMSVGTATNINISTDRGFKAELHHEAGVLGPNAGVRYKTPTVSLFGIKLQGDVAAKVGVGWKQTVGAGVTVDKTKPKFRGYFKVGVLKGAGTETSLDLNVELDTEMSERIQQNANEIANSRK